MFFKRLALTIAYVTSIPVGAYFEEADLEGLGKYLPLVGLIIGGLLAGATLALACIRADSMLASTILTLAWLAITGSLHMDGLMDTADGIFSHQTKERMLEIMQDSRVGNFGVLSGIAVVLLKLAGINALLGCDGNLVPALILIPVASRLAELYTIARFSYARESGKGKVWHDSTDSPRDLVLGAIPLVAAGIALSFLYSPLAVLVISVSTLMVGLISAHQLNGIVGGQTGDTYGAVVELSEAGGLVISALVLNFIH